MSAKRILGKKSYLDQRRRNQSPELLEDKKIDELEKPEKEGNGPVYLEQSKNSLFMQ